MRHVISAPISADAQIGRAVSMHVVQTNGPQHADTQRVQLGEPYRSDARRDVGFDDAQGIWPLFKRAYVHRYVRPSRPCKALDERCDARIAAAEENIAATEYRGE